MSMSTGEMELGKERSRSQATISNATSLISLCDYADAEPTQKPENAEPTGSTSSTCTGCNMAQKQENTSMDPSASTAVQQRVSVK